MSKPRTSLTWTVVEDDATWQSIQAALQAEGSTQPRPTTANRAEWRLASLLLLLLAGGWVWYGQVRDATVASELQRSIQRDVDAAVAWPLSSQPMLAAGPLAPLSGAAHSTTDASRPSASDVQVVAYQIQGDRAMAQVKIDYPTPAGEPLTYRETRFFRQTAEGWRRSEPILGLMDPWQTLETKYFTIRHRAIDDPAVRGAAPRLDLLYEQMRRDFGLLGQLGTQAATPNTIKLVVAYGPWNEYDTSFANRTIIVPSPTMLSIPVEMTDALIFYQSVVYPLASLALADMNSQHPYISKIDLRVWGPVIGALRVWEVWHADGPLAEGRQPVVAWLYQNTQAVTSDAYKTTPAEYEHLCRLYSVWKLSPRTMAIPLTCSDADKSMEATYNKVLPTRLNGLAMGIQHISLPVTVVDSTVAWETLLEYVVATYGRDHLPRLIMALNEHRGWLSLSPAVFGIPAADFEKGWQAYLADHYSSDTK